MCMTPDDQEVLLFNPYHHLPRTQISLRGQRIKEVEQFKYLGSLMSNDGLISSEITKGG